jgi:hypothetical protein
VQELSVIGAHDLADNERILTVNETQLRTVHDLAEPVFRVSGASLLRLPGQQGASST